VSRRLLGIFPHPDDEAWAAGGLLATCAVAGVEVTVATATRGEAGPRPPELEGSLGERRAAELAAACAALGVGGPVFFDLPDGGVAGIDPARAVEPFVEVIERVAPQVVVTLGRDGGYGHRDHLAVTRLAQRACASARATPRLLHCSFRPGALEPIWRMLRPVVDPSVRREDLGADWDRAPLSIDVGPVRDRKIAAVAAHRSQLPPDGDPMTFLMPGFLAGLLDEERYTVALGPELPAGSTDPFAGLRGCP
jgi:LmbE family N-acetylglucosaminyl deacetylase